MARCVVPNGLRILGKKNGFPDLGQIHVVMRGSPDSQSVAASRMTEKIVDSFGDDSRDDNRD